MKKKIISFVGLALFVGAVALNVQMTNQTDDVTLKNIEALSASAESSGGNCYWSYKKSWIYNNVYIMDCNRCRREKVKDYWQEDDVCG